MEENIYYVYVYCDPRKPGHYVYGEYEFDYEPFYVGKGSNGRSRVHLCECYQNNNGNKSFINKIRKIQRITGNDPIVIKYRENMLEDVSFDLEVNMVATIGRYDKKKGPLCNLTDAGDGPSGRKCSFDTRKKISKTEGDFYILNPIEKEKISVRQRERFLSMSEEDKKVIREKQKIVMSNPIIRNKMKVKAVERSLDIKYRENMSKIKKQYYDTHTDHRIPINFTFKGKKHTEKTIEKMKEKSSGINNGFYGKKHTNESKRKMSNTRKNKIRISLAQIYEILQLKYDGLTYNKISIVTKHSFNTVKKVCGVCMDMVKEWLKDGKPSEFDVDMRELKSVLHNKGFDV